MSAKADIVESTTKSKQTTSWIICAAVWLNNFLVDGMMSFPTAVLYSALVNEYPKDHRGITAMVTSLASSVMALSGPLSVSLCERLSCRFVCFLGSILCVIGMVSSSFVGSIQEMFITFSALFACGYSMVFMSGQVILGKHFKSNLGLAVGIGSSGTAAGSLAFAVILEALYSNLGLRTGFLVQGALVAIPLFTACLFTPPRREQIIEKPKQFYDWTIFKNKALMVYYISVFICFFGFLIPRTFLVQYAVDIGVHPTKAAWLAGISSAGSLFGRITVARLSTCAWFDSMTAQQLGFLLLACSLTILPAAHNYLFLAALSFFMGIGDSGFTVTVLVVCKELTGDKFAQAFGVIQIVLCFPLASGPPITGWIYDVTQSYTVPFLVGGGIVFSGILLMFTIPWLKLSSTMQDNTSERNTENSVADGTEKSEQISTNTDENKGTILSVPTLTQDVHGSSLATQCKQMMVKSQDIWDPWIRQSQMFTPWTNGKQQADICDRV